MNPMVVRAELWDRSLIARWAPLPLRLIVGYGFMAHGYAKLMKGPDVFAGILHVIGVPAPHLMAWLTILVELFGGLAVLLGAFVPLVSLPMAAVLLVAMFTVHLPYGFTSIKLMAVTAAGPQFGPPGYETDLLYLACLASLLMSGPGPLSIRLARWPWRQESRKADRSRRASVRASPYQTPFLRRTDMLRKTLVALAATASLAAGTLLFTGIATSSGVARAALQPVDPAHAPVAAVDRFNDKAGTLLLRSTDTRLPGPNEPIDFDTPPLNNLGFTPTGERTLYYRLDVQSTTPAPVYILYREGEDKPVASQLDIIDTLPGEKGYNDFVGAERLCRQHDCGRVDAAASRL
jgi:putative oxidoreductase